MALKEDSRAVNFGPRGEFQFPEETCIKDSTLASTVAALAKNPVSITALKGQLPRIYSLVKTEIHSPEACYLLTKTTVTLAVVQYFINDAPTTTLSLRKLITT